ncbi:MAG: hypothetical protein QM644_20435 [Mobilitalea sp.]
MKKIVMALAIIATIGIVLFIIRPVSFEKNLLEGNMVLISYTNNYIENGYPNTEYKNYSFTIEDTEYQKVKEILERYSYHTCFKTLIGGTVKNFGNSFLLIFENEYISISNVPDIFVGGRVYHVGYWGDSKINKLYNELFTLLKPI